ncbi:MAG TPA: hypothetical protein VMV79_07690, partial [Alphaproteobacteria bacterium]|nr:hypothetical protein [Alphaproteobacteria bacterium]
MTGISFSPKRILVVGLMKNRADVTTDAFAATLADGFKSCGVVEESIFQESETPRLSLAKEDRMSLFWKKMREK